MGATLRIWAPPAYAYAGLPYIWVSRFLRIILSHHVPRLHKLVDGARNAVKRGNGETWKIWEELASQAEEVANEYQVRDMTELQDRTERNGEPRWGFPTTTGQALEPGLNVHSIRENFQPHD